MKYMILPYASQRDYDRMAGKAGDQPAWTADDVAAMARFMESWNNELVESGEFVEARGAGRSGPHAADPDRRTASRW